MSVWGPLVVFCGTVGPLFLVVGVIYRSLLRPSFRRPSRYGLMLWVLAAGCAAGFVFFNPHRDVYTGLDAAKYRLMTQAWVDGRELNAFDSAFSAVPDPVKPDLLSRRALHGDARLTRDGVFELVAYPGAETAPFFVPILSLAAAGGAHLGLSIDGFVPLVALCWVAAILGAAVFHGGRWGASVAVACVLGTAWPAWFLRGFHAEAVGGVMLATVIASRVATRPRWRLNFVLGCLLGLSVAYHLTLVVLAPVVGLWLILKNGRWRDTLALAVGGGVGVSPLLILHLSVCRPYGDFLDPAVLFEMFRKVPQIRFMLMAGMVVVCVVFVLAILAHVPAMRRILARPPFRQAASADTFLLLLLAWALPFVFGGAWKRAVLDSWTGIGLFAGVVVVSAGFLYFRRHAVADRFLFAALGAVGVLYLAIQGAEVPVGIWSQRRLTPVVLCLATVLAPVLASGVRQVAWRWPRPACLLSAGLLVPAVWHLMAGWPAYFTVHDAGADAHVAWVSTHVNAAGEDGLTFFDYHLHSMPHQLRTDRQIFGLNEHVGRAHEHAAVVAWVAGEAAAGRSVCVLSAYPGVASIVEDGLLLRLTAQTNVVATRTLTRAFFPISQISHPILTSVYAGEALAESNLGAAVQHARPAASPLGLRPPWGRRAQGGVWSVSGSGVVGPLPPPGGGVRVCVEVSWIPPEPGWSHQVLVVTPPFAGDALELSVPAGTNVCVTGVLMPQTGTAERAGFSGVYRLDVRRPYDPSAYGISGYRSDLGVVVYSVRLELIDSDESKTP